MPVHTTLDPVEATTKAVDALLTAIDGAPGAGAAAAYRSAITRHGRTLIEQTGTKGMRAALDRIATPDQTTRRAIVLDAWARVPGWYLGAGADA